MRSHNIKAGFFVCLFLCVIIFNASGNDEQWSFDVTTQKLYDMVLDLDLNEVQRRLADPQTTQQTYVLALAEALELLLEEDGERYTEYEDRFEKRRERKTRLNSPDDLFLQAELSLQWAFVYFKFGHEFDAAINLREAYIVTTELKRRYPKYEAIRKTSAMLEIIVGSVPEKYNWVLSLLNIEGSIEKGLRQFEGIRFSNSPLKLEAGLLHTLIECYVLQQPDTAMTRISKIRQEHPANRLALFVGASIAIKNSQSETAFNLLTDLAARKSDFQIDYADYLLGEIYLTKAEYLNSITSYRTFVNQYKGQNNIKDAYYKIGLCYWLNGNVNDARATFKLARNTGKEVTEADKYAARSLAEDELPHPKLTKARYATDGGYYSIARQILDSVAPGDLPTQRDRIECVYRKARLEHKAQNLEKAKDLYLEVITLNGASPWYFAPNSSLQLGYIFLQQDKNVLAEEYFEMALSYKKHEYKNSIDTKARSSLAQIRRK